MGAPNGFLRSFRQSHDNMSASFPLESSHYCIMLILLCETCTQKPHRYHILSDGCTLLSATQWKNRGSFKCIINLLTKLTWKWQSILLKAPMRWGSTVQYIQEALLGNRTAGWVNEQSTGFKEGLQYNRQPHIHTIISVHMVIAIMLINIILTGTLKEIVVFHSAI